MAEGDRHGNPCQIPVLNLDFHFNDVKVKLLIVSNRINSMHCLNLVSSHRILDVLLLLII